MLPTRIDTIVEDAMLLWPERRILDKPTSIREDKETVDIERMQG